jgi:hypothetical protein
MHVIQKFTYTNRTQSRLLIILEPWAEEYWIDPGQQIEVEVRNGTPGHQLELEQTSEGSTIHGWEGTVICILRDGRNSRHSERGNVPPGCRD